MTQAKIDSLLKKKQIKNIIFSVFLIAAYCFGFVLVTKDHPKLGAFILLISFLCLCAAMINLMKIYSLRKKIKRNPEHYINDQGELIRGDLSLLLASWFFW